jgi:hypothetical protein
VETLTSHQLTGMLISMQTYGPWIYGVTRLKKSDTTRGMNSEDIYMNVNSSNVDET